MTSRRRLMNNGFEPMTLVTYILNPQRYEYVIEVSEHPGEGVYDRMFAKNQNDALACFASQMLRQDTCFIVVYWHEGQDHYRIIATCYL